MGSKALVPVALALGAGALLLRAFAQDDTSLPASSPAPTPPGGPEPGRFTGPVEPYADRADLASGPCDPDPKPGVKLFRQMVLARFGGTDLGISRACSGAVATSEHNLGRAWDWGTLQGGARVEDFFTWLFAPEGDEPHALLRRAGVMYLIYNRHMWRAYGPREWLAYTGPNPHTDHVHLSFSRAGGAGLTSLYLGGGA